MSNDVTSVGLVVGTATMINTVYAVQKNRDPVPPLVASGILFAGLALTGELTRKWELAVAFAWVFLLASLISRGIPLLQSVSRIVNARPAQSRQGSTNAGGTTGGGTAGGGGGGGGGGGR